MSHSEVEAVDTFIGPLFFDVMLVGPFVV